MSEFNSNTYEFVLWLFRTNIFKKNVADSSVTNNDGDETNY